MPRYKVNCKVGPWSVGDVFESNLERHAVLAAEGYLTDLSATEEEPPAGEEETESPADETSEEQELPSDVELEPPRWWEKSVG
jgi:hypothetical protein